LRWGLRAGLTAGGIRFLELGSDWMRMAMLLGGVYTGGVVRRGLGRELGFVRDV